MCFQVVYSCRLTHPVGCHVYEAGYNLKPSSDLLTEKPKRYSNIGQHPLIKWISCMRRQSAEEIQSRSALSERRSRRIFLVCREYQQRLNRKTVSGFHIYFHTITLQKVQTPSKEGAFQHEPCTHATLPPTQSDIALLGLYKKPFTELSFTDWGSFNMEEPE